MTLTRRIIFLLALVLSVGHGQHSMASDGASFNPIPVTVTSQGTYPVGAVIQWPSTSFPPDAGRSLECNGQAVPSGSQYDRLRAIIGVTVPNYNDKFLRGTTMASQVGTQVSDSIRSHTVYIPGQNAPVSGNLNSTGLSGNLNSTSISGSASSQSYSYQAATGSDTVLTWQEGAPNFGQTQAEHMGWASGSTSGGSISGSLNSGGLSGSLYSGALTGTAYVAGQTGSYSGGAETAPVHTKVRYLIRAVQ
jgi:hypothetical protein